MLLEGFGQRNKVWASPRVAASHSTDGAYNSVVVGSQTFETMIQGASTGRL